MSTIYIIGAGISGLAAAKKLVDKNHKIVVFEATNYPGGRCRTFYDEKLGLEIDNGTHLALFSNNALMELADSKQLFIAEKAKFDFVNLKTNSKWDVNIGSGKIPWLSSKPPGASLWNLLNDFRKLNCDRPISDILDTSSARWGNFWAPLILAVMNTDPSEASARLMYRVLSETLLRGGYYSRPVMALNGLSKAFVEPTSKRVDVRYGAIMKGSVVNNNKVTKIIFRDFEIELKTDDALIMALPWVAAHEIFPYLPKPSEFNPIINVHFKTANSVKNPQMIGLVGGCSHWIFRRKNIASVTISAASELAKQSSETIAKQVWDEVCKLSGGGSIPEHRVIKEKLATFKASPTTDASRPATVTRFANMFIAGDWTATGLPATMEGAARSGFASADAVERFLSCRN